MSGGDDWGQRTPGMTEAERLAWATLMFHGGGEWGEKERARWRDLTGFDDATTRTLGILASAIVKPSHRCLRCGSLTFHPHDILERYCGRCHRFARDQEEPKDI